MKKKSDKVQLTGARLRAATKKAPASAAPVPVRTDGRNCFGLAWFKTEQEADAYAKLVQGRGERYNGGWLDGKPCGREEQFDYVDPKHGKLYAVSEA